MNLVFNLILKDILNKEIFFVLEKRVIALFMTIFLRNEKVLVLTPTQGTVAVHGNNRLKNYGMILNVVIPLFLRFKYFHRTEITKPLTLYYVKGFLILNQCYSF